MPFDSGRVSFSRFMVHGDGPSAVDDTLLSILSEHRFVETEIGTPDEVEVGFVTAEHLLDSGFTFEKTGFGPGGTLALFGLRMDTHKPPADLKKAYRLMQEQAAATASPTGYASKGDKREALDNADRQIREELAAGKHRKSKLIPMLWDLSRKELFTTASGNTVVEHLSRLMRQAFVVDLEPLTAGTAAMRVAAQAGRTRDHEDLSPTAFTKPPAEASGRADAAEEVTAAVAGTPTVPWVAKSVDLKDFLGNEFLVWLWWRSETTEGPFEAGEAQVHAAFDKALDMDCAWGVGGRQSLRGDGPTRLGEAGEALRNGKWPRKLGLLMSDGEVGFELTLAGDAYAVAGAKLPEAEEAQTRREVVEARLESVRLLSDLLDGMYAGFLKARTGGSWGSVQVPEIRAWIRDRAAATVTSATAAEAPPALRMAE